MEDLLAECVRDNKAALLRSEVLVLEPRRLVLRLLLEEAMTAREVFVFAAFVDFQRGELPRVVVLKARVGDERALSPVVLDGLVVTAHGGVV